MAKGWLSAYLIMGDAKECLEQSHFGGAEKKQWKITKNGLEAGQIRRIVMLIRVKFLYCGNPYSNQQGCGAGSDQCL